MGHLACPFQDPYTSAIRIVALLVTFVGPPLGAVGWTIVNTWLYDNTRNVRIIILLHRWGNTVQSFLVMSSKHMADQALYGMLPWVVAIVSLWVYGAENRARHTRPQGEHGQMIHTTERIAARAFHRITSKED